MSTRVAPASPVVGHGPAAWRLLVLMLVIGVLAAVITGLFAGWATRPQSDGARRH